jgi:hypothetical protein
MTTPAFRLLRCATLLLASLAVLSMPASAQGKTEQDPLDLMREDLREKRYADVIRRGNDLLGSSRTFTVGEQVMLWQVMAAAYFPPDVMAQRPDSARLPLDALVRLAPDAELAEDLRWPGLDSLLQRSRDATFAVVARPQPEYVVSSAEPAYVTVVASRPARFRLTSISSATGVATVHDSGGATRSATLRLRAHDGTRPIFGSGDYLLQVTAIDEQTGDSVVVTRRALARANGNSIGPAIPPFTPPASVRVAAMRRSTLLLGGLAFGGATIAIANGARAQEPIRSGFDADNRAMIVGGAMVAAAVTVFVLDHGRSRPANDAEIARARVAYDRRVAALQAESAEQAGRYRVTLTVDSRDR